MRVMESERERNESMKGVVIKIQGLRKEMETKKQRHDKDNIANNE